MPCYLIIVDAIVRNKTKQTKEKTMAAATIETRYLAPTNTKGTRVKATSNTGKNITVSWDYSLNPEGNHQNAARALVQKLRAADVERMAKIFERQGAPLTELEKSQTTEYVIGWFDNGGYVFVRKDCQTVSL